VRGIDGAVAHERSGDALAVVGLVEHADRRVALLSAGQRERVAIARALAVRPSVILADEPTARIDVAGTLALGGLFADIAIEYGTTFVCATHDQLLIGLADDQVELAAPAPVP
jgi:ABC-type lipoprotein export system ATPase subunit